MPDAHPPVDGFLLTRQWRDARDGIDLSFWASTADGPLCLQVPAQRAVCFAARSTAIELPAGAERKPLRLRVPGGEPVDAIYTLHQRTMVELAQRKDCAGKLHESDVKPADRYLMERFVHGGFRATGAVIPCDGYRLMRNPQLQPADTAPDLRTASIDIETRGLSGQLYSIGIHCAGRSIVLMNAGGQAPATEGYELIYCGDEKQLLTAFFEHWHQIDPDIIIGWNVVNFDLNYLALCCRRNKVPFAFARGGEEAAVLQPGNGSQRLARIPGRAVLDGVDTLRAAFYQFESFSLEYVAHHFLGRGKLITRRDRAAEIDHLYQCDKPALARYNIEDCRLVTEIFDKADLLNFAVQRAQMTGLAIDRSGGAVQTFDNLYLPKLHRRGFVAPLPPADDGRGSPGGYVMDSQPGLYRNVIVLDFKSLYPGIIRTFLIDPLGLAIDDDDPVPGFDGARFSRTEHLLPGLVEELWNKRDQAKASGNKALSQAIKIIMNSLYGVLGSGGCRFHHHQLASSITKRGHQIIQQSRVIIEEAGYRVIYGDTDSLFVLLGDEHGMSEANTCGVALQDRLNSYWQAHLAGEYRLQSALEVEFETHYLRFVMPTIRGSDSGSKKRYAGLVEQGGKRQVVFKGLEAVRTDWSPLAREFQRELYDRIFSDRPYEDLIRDTAAGLLAGELDDKLVYRKRLRRQLSEYTRNVPPHVQAARKLKNPGRSISYVITVNGPEPSDERQSPIDYEHYMNKQLAPVADGILHFLDQQFETLTGAQFQLF